MINKIVNIANIDPSEKAGGLNLMVRNIIDTQNKIGINSVLLYFNEPKFELVNKEKYIKYKNLMLFSKTVNKDTHYIFHSIYNIKYIFLILIILLLGSSYSIHSHGSLSKHSIRKSWKKKYIYIININLILRFAKKIIFSNESEYLNSILKDDKKVYYIPNLIPSITQLRSEEKKDLKKIIYIGKIDYYYKGIDNLMLALSHFLSNHHDYTVDIYGFGNKKDLNISKIDRSEKDIIKLLHSIKKYKIESKVKFKGPITGQKKINILEKSGVFILTSNSEAMPLSISEALACSVPVIATKQTNMGKYIISYKAGIVCENNPTDIFNALKLYNDEVIPNYDFYKKNALKCYQSELDYIYLDKYIKNFIKCLE